MKSPGVQRPRILSSEPLVSTLSPASSSLSLQPSSALSSPGCGSRRLRSISSQARRGRPSPRAPPWGRREGSPGRARGGGGCPGYKAWTPPAEPGTAGTLGSRTGRRRLELRPFLLRDPKRLIPPGPEWVQVGAQARGMLGSVKMEAHDLAEWSYYPEAGEVCPRVWRSGKWE